MITLERIVGRAAGGSSNTREAYLALGGLIGGLGEEAALARVPEAMRGTSARGRPTVLEGRSLVPAL